MLCAVFSLVAVMMLLNILITPFYMGVERSLVIEMIPTLLFPFNLAKGLVNASFALLLYKPIATTLRRSGFMPSSKKSGQGSAERENVERFTFTKSTVIIIIVAALTLVAATVILYTLDAQIFFK